MHRKVVPQYVMTIALLLAMVGCSREDEQAIVIQQVPKQPAPATRPLLALMAPEKPAMLPPGHPQIPDGAPMGAAQAAAAPSSGQVTYTNPEGWIKDPPMPLRTFSFHLGSGEDQADIIVSQLAATGSSTPLMNINRWRGQAGLEPLQQGDKMPTSKPIIVGGESGDLFDMLGSKRLIVAWIPKGNVWWFFKINGPPKIIERERPKFEEFLKSVQFVSEKP